MKQSLLRYEIRTQIGPRKGALLRLEDDQGNVGWGDIAPLPGFSSESLDEAIRSLSDEPSPSAHFAQEVAKLRLQASQLGTTLRHLLNPKAVNELQVAGLCHVGAKRPRNYPVLKVKVARQPMEDEINWLKEHFSSGKQRLRLDANQGWTQEQAWQFAGRCQELPVDYIEEPYPGAVFEANDFPLPLAADESVYQDLSSASRLCARVSHIIVKPSLIGGPSRLQSLLGVRPLVFSSCFESSVGASAVAELAAAYQLADCASGLDPWTWLEEDVLGLSCPINHASLDLSSWTLPTSSASLPSTATR